MKARKSKTPRASLNSIGIAALAVSAIAFSAGSANAVSTESQPTVKVSQPRAAGDTVIWKTSFQDMAVSLWSSTSGYKWVQISGTGGRASEAGVYSDRTGWRFSTSYGRSPSSYTTPVVYAPGRTCVSVRLTAVNLRGSTGSQTWRVC